MKIPHHMEDVDHLMTISTEPQVPWSLRTDNVKPCDTDCTVTLPSENQRIMHKPITDPMTTPLPHTLPLKMLCFREIEAL